MTDVLDSLHLQHAEQIIIASIIANPSVADNVANILKPADFYDEVYSYIYGILLDSSSRGEINHAYLKTRLEAYDGFQDVNVGEYIQGWLVIANQVPIEETIQYAGIVLELSKRRKLITASQELIANALNTSDYNLELNVAVASTKIIDAMTGGDTGKVVNLAGDDLIQDLINTYDDPILGARTGIANLDRAVGVFGRGKLIVIGGRP